MSAGALRAWGIGVSAALLVGALALSRLAPAPGWTAQPRPPADAEAEAPAAVVSFIVRFRGGGPIARAQALAERGGMRDARRRIESQLQQQGDFAGLCFDGFTLGAAEIVLASCEPAPGGARGEYARAWLARLRAMQAVEYADLNQTAAPAAPE